MSFLFQIDNFIIDNSGMSTLLFLFTISAIAFTSVGYTSIAQAADENTNPYVVPPISAVESKLFVPEKDLAFKLGVLPLDAFYKAITLGLSYTKNFESFWGWEIINTDVAFTQDTGLKTDLLDNFAVKPNGILTYPQYYVTTNLVYTPIYAKNLLFNKKVVRSEISFAAGGGMLAFNSGENVPMVGTAFIMRFYQSQAISYKFDTRLYYHISPNKSSNLILNIGFAMAFEFGDGTTANVIK